MFDQKNLWSGAVAASLLMVLIGVCASQIAATTIESRPCVLERVGAPLSTFESNDFSGSGNCAFCHSALLDQAGGDVSMDTQWRSTLKANASKDPLWQAKLSSEVYRHPALQAAIEEKCSRCHMPMARVQALADGIPIEILGNGFLNPAHPLHQAAMDAVSCTLCHQIQPTDLGQPESYSGHYVIDTSTAAPDRLIFAQFANVCRNPMRMRVGYTPMPGTHVALAGLCGSCHTLYTPVVDGNGQIVGEFPEQMTHPEWVHSEFGDGLGVDRSCQDCHLPLATGGAKISNRPMGLTERSPVLQHHFVGANLLMLRMLTGHVDELGLTTSEVELVATQERTLEQLQTATAALSVLDAQLVGAELTLTLRVENQAGHKLPSGIPARRAWLHVTVVDRAGQICFESGAPQADGRIAGNAADEEPLAFEPHYSLISSSNQVQIYEGVMRDTDGAVTYTLLRAADYVKDNRLLPMGFDKATASDEIAVHGEAALDDDFIGGSDRVDYVVDVRGHCGPFTVAAELLFQGVGFRFAQDLRQDSTPEVVRFGTYLEGTDQAPGVLAVVEQSVGAACAAGDLNCDAVVNFDDIDPFVLALSDPNGYQQQYPFCSVLSGDCSGDGVVDFNDIDPFVAILSGS